MHGLGDRLLWHEAVWGACYNRVGAAGGAVDGADGQAWEGWGWGGGGVKRGRRDKVWWEAGMGAERRGRRDTV